MRVDASSAVAASFSVSTYHLDGIDWRSRSKLVEGLGDGLVEGKVHVSRCARLAKQIVWGIFFACSPSVAPAEAGRPAWWATTARDGGWSAASHVHEICSMPHVTGPPALYQKLGVGAAAIMGGTSRGSRASIAGPRPAQSSWGSCRDAGSLDDGRCGTSLSPCIIPPSWNPSVTATPFSWTTCWM